MILIMLGSRKHDQEQGQYIEGDEGFLFKLISHQFIPVSAGAAQSSAVVNSFTLRYQAFIRTIFCKLIFIRDKGKKSWLTKVKVKMMKV